MKKLLLASIIVFSVILQLNGQSVSNYSYVLDNGINIKTERCWSHVWVQQTNEPIKEGTQSPVVGMSIRTLGDLIIAGSSTIKLLSSGKEVRIQGAAPGTYDLKVTNKLSGRPGTLSFIVPNVVVKPKMKTTVSLTLYDYQLTVTEAAGTLNGLSSFESSLLCFKGSSGQNPHKLTVTFYEKGKHDAKITPDEATSETKGKIKAGTYDVLLTLGISDETHLVWLENFTLKPNTAYKLTTNLNAGIISYSGGNKDVKSMLLYPSGTAAQQGGKAAPDKSKEILSYESNISAMNACRPGSYDILLGLGKGDKFEWRKNITVTAGVRADVK